MSEASEVADFFSDWATYRAVIEADAMEHRRVYAGVHGLLQARPAPFTLLDLGCGDAAGTVVAMRGTGVARYVGVDCAAPALDHARAMLAGTDAEVELRVGDLLETLEAWPGSVDVILVAFALHHLPADDKRRFLHAAWQCLAPGGDLVLVDVVRKDGETRDGYLARYERFVGTWAVPPDARARIVAHVTGYDFPEQVSAQPAWARDAGFTAVEEFYRGARDTQAGWQLAR